jgi:CheY-like chemotaxis protein
MKYVTCFLIDDDEEDIEIFEYALEGSEVPGTCISAQSGNEALIKLKNEENFTPDFIFLDLNMPGMHGTDCLVEIKKIPRFKNIPVIIASTSMYQEHEEKLIRLYAAHYLIKPTNVVTFSKILTDIFKKKNLPFFLNY